MNENLRGDNSKVGASNGDLVRTSTHSVASKQEMPTVPIHGFWWILGPVALLSLVPFVLLAFYCQPITDDFQFAAHVHEDGFWNAQRMWYRQLTGRYVNTAILSLLAGYVDMNSWYWVVPCYLLLGLFFATWVLLGRVNRWLPRPGDSAHRLLATLLFVSLFIVTMPSPADGLYWLSGAHSYVGVGIIAMFCGACLVPPTQSETTVRALSRFMIAGLLAMAAVGSNETMLVLLASLLGLGTGICFLYRTRFRYYWLMVLMMAACSALVVLLCPGNARRLKYERENGEYTLLNAIVGDIGTVGQIISNVFFSPVLFFSLCLWLILVRFQIDNTKFDNLKFGRFAWGVPFIFVAVLGLAGFPAWWALGSQPPLRTQNMLHLFCLLMCLSGLAFWVVLAGPKRTRWLKRSPRFMLILSILLACSFVLTSQERMAWNDWLRFANGYSQQQKLRLKLIEQSHKTGELRVQFSRLRNAPLTIHAGDITPDAKHWINTGAARYYKVKEIWKLTGDVPMEEDEPNFDLLRP